MNERTYFKAVEGNTAEYICVSPCESRIESFDTSRKDIFLRFRYSPFVTQFFRAVYQEIDREEYLTEKLKALSRFDKSRRRRRAVA